MRKLSTLLILCTFAFRLSAQTPEDPLLRAYHAFDQNDHVSVVKLLTEYLERDRVPEIHLVQVHYLLGEAYYELGKSAKHTRRFRDAWEKAYTHLATVRDLDKAHFAQMAQETQEFLAPYLYNAGVKQYNKGNYAQAHRYFWKTRQIFPQDPKVWLASAFTLWKLDRYDDAREAWSVAREAQQPSRYITADDSAVRHEAHVYWQRFVQQLGPESLATLSPFPQPFSWSPPLTQVFQAKNGSEKDDLAVLRQQIQQFPEDVRARASYAAILWHDDQRPAARVAYQEILMYDPQHQMAHQCWANFYMEKAFDAYMQYQTRYDARRQKGMYIQPYTYLEKALPHLEALLDETNEKWPSYVTAIQNCLVAAKAKEAN